MKAIEMGIITDTTKARLLALEQEHGQLLAKIDTAKRDGSHQPEDFVSLLDIYRTGDVNNKSIWPPCSIHSLSGLTFMTTTSRSPSTRQAEKCR